MAVATTLSKDHQMARTQVTAPRTASSLPRLAGSRPGSYQFIEARHAVTDEFEASTSLPPGPTTGSRRA